MPEDLWFILDNRYLKTAIELASLAWSCLPPTS